MEPASNVRVYSPSETAEKLREALGWRETPPPPAASIARKKEWIARNSKVDRVSSLDTAGTIKIFNLILKGHKEILVSTLDKMQHLYVGFEGMSWEQFKSETINRLFSTSGDDGDARYEREIKKLNNRTNTGYFNRLLKRELVIDPDRIDKPLWHRWHVELLNAGAKMETTKEMITAVSDELRKAKQEMQDLANEVTTMSELVSVKLAKQLETIRNNRMSAVRELQDVLAPLKALRTFFDNGGDRDVNRIEKLNALCAQLEGFHRSGALSGLVMAMQTMSRVPHEG